MSHLVHLSICPIADDLDQLEDPCWILRDTCTDSSVTLNSDNVIQQLHIVKTQLAQCRTAF